VHHGISAIVLCGRNSISTRIENIHIILTRLFSTAYKMRPLLLSLKVKNINNILHLIKINEKLIYQLCFIYTIIYIINIFSITFYIRREY